MSAIQPPAQPPAATSLPAPSAIPPTPQLSPEVAQRYGARILDPVTGMRRSDGSAPAATVYVGERLLMRTTPGRALDDTVQALNEVTKDFGVRAERIPTPPAKGERALHPEAMAVLQRHWVDGVRLLPVDDQVRMPVDAWPVLAAVASRDAAAAAPLALDRADAPLSAWCSPTRL